MAKITFQGTQYEREEGVSVLDTLLNQGLTVPHGCKGGVCQSCLMRATEGEVPADAQKALKEMQQKKNFFLACSCYPENDLTIVLPGEDEIVQFHVNVLEKEWLNQHVIRLRLSLPENFEYKAGQFINIIKDAENHRSYSLASLPGADNFLELQIRVLPDGLVSNWIGNEVNPGDEMLISEALGDCYYSAGDADQSILLIGTGTGLAPLVGVVRDALSQGHAGKISLYHGASTSDELYLKNDLLDLAAQCSNFQYTPCVSQGIPGENEESGRSSDVALAQNPSLKNYKIYLCGNPNMIEVTRKKAFLAGANFKDILVDAFKFANA